jgi:hypothetical protein
MPSEDKMYFTIAPVSEIRRGLRSNLGAIASIFLALVLWCTISAGLVDFFNLTNNAHGYLDSIYFTVINVTTVGFGDIVPIAAWGKVLSMINALLGLIFFGCLIAAVTAAFQPAEYQGAVSNGVRGGDGDPLERQATSLTVALQRLVDALRYFSAQESNEQGPEGRGSVRIQINTGRDDWETVLTVETFRSHRRPG